MARGDYPKTTFVNGTAPPIDATYLNRLETKVSGMDLIQATQTPLNDGLVCAPLASVPEWPDNAAGTTYLQDAWATVDGWGGNTENPTAAPGILTIKPNGAYRVDLATAGNTIKIKMRASTSQIVNLLFDGGGGTFVAASVTTEWQIFSGIIPAGASGLLQIGIGTIYSTDVSFIYIGDGTYTSLALDGSGSGNHATVYGATPVNTVAGRGFSLDGVNDYIKAALVTPVYGFSGWFYTAMSATADALFCALNADHYVFGPGVWTGGITDETFTIETGVNTFAYIKDTAALGWHHIAFSWNGSGYDIYLDGTERTLHTLGSPTLMTSEYFQVGKFQTFYSYGTIADPRIYNRALTAEEVWELYSKPGMSRVSGPVDSVTPIPNSRVVRDADGVNNADTVSGYGIGVDTIPYLTVDLDTLVKGGIYSCSYAIGRHFPLGLDGLVLVIPGSSLYTRQIYFCSTEQSLIYERAQINGVWSSTWGRLWDSISDGNGGQPPAPKPRNSAGNIGHWIYTTDTLPATGIFATISFKTGLFYACDAGVAGGSNMNTVYSTTGINAVIYWRTE